MTLHVFAGGTLTGFLESLLETFRLRENQDCMNSYAKLGHLPGPVRGVLWMMLSSLFYALIYVVVRGLAESFAVNQIVFFRAVLGSTFMLPWLFTAGLGALYTRRMPTYLWRMLFSYVGAVAWMYGIAGMPIADLCCRPRPR